MPEVKDPAIKLFGRNILVPEIQTPLDSLQVSDLEYQQPQLMDECLDATKIEVEDPPVENSYQLGSSSNLDKAEDNNCQTLNSENEAKVSNKREEDQGTERDMGNQEKVLKKPDKVLPCPRCNSLNTKFCYFNNYNMNQPRHFCKNCQRYWTAGGTMRNVPVGAGRRKNKHLSLQYRQEVVPPDAVSGSQANTLNSAGNHHLSYVGIPSSSIPVKGIGEVLKFGTDAPLCESMETVLNLKDQKRSVEMGSVVVEGNCGEPSSSGSSFSATTCWENELSERKMEQASLRGHSNCFTPMHPLQFYPGSPLAYPLNPSWNAVMFGPDGSNSNPAQNGSPPIVAVPGFCTPTITIPCVSASYWGCMPSWNMPLAGTGNHSLSSSTSNSGCSGNSSPTLGKHSRDGNLQAEEKTEQCLWVPKTLRIDGPNEVAKSSIWATLGIKPDQSKPIRRGGIFKAFQPKSDTSSNTSDGDQVMEANPAALSRSQSFQEST